jgi:hypothetical protein
LHCKNVKVRKVNFPVAIKVAGGTFGVNATNRQHSYQNTEQPRSLGAEQTGLLPEEKAKQSAVRNLGTRSATKPVHPEKSTFFDFIVADLPCSRQPALVELRDELIRGGDGAKGWLAPVSRKTT